MAEKGLHIDIRALKAPRVQARLKRGAAQRQWTFLPASRLNVRPDIGLPLFGTVQFSEREAEPCINMLRDIAKTLAHTGGSVSFQCGGGIVDLTQPVASIKARLRRLDRHEGMGFTIQETCKFLDPPTAGRVSRNRSHQIPVCT